MESSLVSIDPTVPPHSWHCEPADRRRRYNRRHERSTNTLVAGVLTVLVSVVVFLTWQSLAEGQQVRSPQVDPGGRITVRLRADSAPRDLQNWGPVRQGRIGLLPTDASARLAENVAGCQTKLTRILGHGDELDGYQFVRPTMVRRCAIGDRRCPRYDTDKLGRGKHRQRGSRPANTDPASSAKSAFSLPSDRRIPSLGSDHEHSNPRL